MRVTRKRENIFDSNQKGKNLNKIIKGRGKQEVYKIETIKEHTSNVPAHVAALGAPLVYA